MVLINKFTGRVVASNMVDEWVCHYDKGANETVILLGDEVVETEPGNMSLDMCQEIVDASWDTYACGCKSQYIIDDNLLKDSIVESLSEQLEVEEEVILTVLTDDDCSEIVSAMWEAESDATWKLSSEIEDRLESEKE